MLRPYQVEGVRFLVEHEGGALLDDPGLGKTRQAIEAAVRLARYPILVVCPSSLRYWWAQEIENVLPHAKIQVAGQGGRGVQEQDGWTVVHYEGLWINKDFYYSVIWGTIISDEMHNVKNRKAKRTKALQLATPIDAVRIGLTATPFSTNPADLWSQLVWLDPDFRSLYPGYWGFADEWCNVKLTYASGRALRKTDGVKDERRFAQFLSRWCLRRSKRTVAPEIPPLTEQRVPLALEGRQADVYGHLKRDIEVAIKGGAQLTITNALARLITLERYLSCPWTLDPKVSGVKLEFVQEYVADTDEPGVILTHFRDSAIRIADELHVTPVLGGQSDRDRVITDFQQGKSKYLVGTIASLGTGTNLQRAYWMICYDQVYSPILMAQTRERIHRMNTDHPTTVIYLTVRGTTNDLVYDAFTKHLKVMEIVNRFIEHLGGATCETS